MEIELLKTKTKLKQMEAVLSVIKEMMKCSGKSTENTVACCATKVKDEVSAEKAF